LPACRDEASFQWIGQILSQFNVLDTLERHDLGGLVFSNPFQTALHHADHQFGAFGAIRSHLPWGRKNRAQMIGPDRTAKCV
jgi:hypothetical protein